jgi:hypothetical protein
MGNAVAESTAATAKLKKDGKVLECGVELTGGDW